VKPAAAHKCHRRVSTERTEQSSAPQAPHQQRYTRSRSLALARTRSHPLPLTPLSTLRSSPLLSLLSLLSLPSLLSLLSLSLHSLYSLSTRSTRPSVRSSLYSSLYAAHQAHGLATKCARRTNTVDSVKKRASDYDDAHEACVPGPRGATRAHVCCGLGNSLTRHFVRRRQRPEKNLRASFFAKANFRRDDESQQIAVWRLLY